VTGGRWPAAGRVAVAPELAVDLLQELLTIPSPSGSEGRLAGFLARAMGQLGLDARIDEAGNVIGQTGTGAGPSVLLLGHMDTVDRPLPVRRDGDRLYGRGAADAKGPLAAMVCAAAARPEFPGTIRVAGTVEEERRSRGAAHLVATMPAPDRLVVGEPGGWSSVVLGYKGKLDIEYRVERPSTHSTNPAAKAGELAVAFWLALLEQLGPERDHARFGHPAATLRAVEGDMVAASLTVDCRLPPGFDRDRFLAVLQERAGDGTLRVLHQVPAVRVERGNPVARSLSAAIRRHGGRPRPLLKTGTADMNLVAASWPVPMAAYGPGDSSLDHADDEHVRLDEYLAAVAVLATALDELAGDLTPR
jgi:[amino group carrier protein]-lysine/ornithine hydrolase